MKNFSKFLEEVSIKGNSGVPGEGRDRNDPKYIRDVENRAKNRNGITPRDEQNWPRVMQQLGPEMMGLVRRSMGLIRGKEKELEALAEKIVRANYNAILDNVVLDIKFSTGREAKENMEESEQEEPPVFKEIDDAEIKKHVDKAKLINNVIQGEAKNTKHMLQLPEVKEDLITILGERKATEALEIWTRLTEIADKKDWLVPVDVTTQMMDQDEEGMGLGGSVKVDWKPKEVEQKTAEEILNDIEENGIEENEVEIAEIFSDGTPTITARGVDFPMLLHETIKGIYELISSVSLPGQDASKEELNIARIAKLNTSSNADEAEDWKYGPEIASDLRDFINVNKDIERYPNLREFVYGKMCAMHPDEFLPLVKGILAKSEQARTKIDSLVSETITEMDEYENQMKGIESDRAIDSYSKEEEPEYGHEDGEFADPDKEEESEIDKLIQQSLYGRKRKEEERPTPSKKDYSKMTNKELEEARTKAEEDEDYRLAGHINSFMTRESRIAFTKYLRLNESKRRK